MKLRISEIIVLIIVLVSFGVGAYFYPFLPERVASHWNVQGQVDGYISKFWGAYLMPIIALGAWLLFVIIPRIDPKRQNIEKFRKYFDWFIVLVTLFLFYLYALTLAWNQELRFNFIRVLAPAFGILFYYIGVLVSHAQPNWTIGIRTPWTLSSDKVWQKTHKLGGKLFKATGILSFFGILFGDFAIWLILIPAIVAAITTIVYSYQKYQQESPPNPGKT
jgi:uncharacterized membrane protein